MNFWPLCSDERPDNSDLTGDFCNINVVSHTDQISSLQKCIVFTGKETSLLLYSRNIGDRCPCWVKWREIRVGRNGQQKGRPIGSEARRTESRGNNKIVIPTCFSVSEFKLPLITRLKFSEHFRFPFNSVNSTSFDVRIKVYRVEKSISAGEAICEGLQEMQIDGCLSSQGTLESCGIFSNEFAATLLLPIHTHIDILINSHIFHLSPPPPSRLPLFPYLTGTHNSQTRNTVK